MEVKDFLLTPIYVLLVMIIAKRYRLQYQDKNLQKYFNHGLLLKMIGAILFGLIYTYYYYGGDTKSYFEGALNVQQFVSIYPFNTLKFIFSPYIATDTEVFQLINGYSYIFRGTSSLTIIKLTTAINMITFQSYFATSVIFAALSFTGLWMLYLTFHRTYPQHHKKLAIIIFYVPSVIFWGSGISKDAIVIGALGWFVYAFFNIFHYKEKRIESIIIMIIAFVLLSQLRGFIVIFLLFSLGLVPFVSYRQGIKNEFIRTVGTPLLFVLAILVGLFLANYLGSRVETYSINSLFGKARDFQQWHAYLQANYGGSGYSLGVFDYTFFGMMKAFIPAINVTLFRPYLWEAGSVVILLSAIESLVIFMITLRLIFKYNIRSTINIIFNEPLLLFSFTFSILYAFAAGFTSYNFGALVRYKIPCIPFYVITLYLVSSYSDRNKKAAPKPVQAEPEKKPQQQKYPKLVTR